MKDEERRVVQILICFSLLIYNHIYNLSSIFLLLANIDLGDLVTIYLVRRGQYSLLFSDIRFFLCIVISNLFYPRCVETHIHMLRFPPVVCFGSGKTAIDSMVWLCRILSYDRNGFDDCGFIQGALLLMLFCCAAAAGLTGAHGSWLSVTGKGVCFS